ncbi:hypothetical protein P7K49_004317 [Saguinus oedipus]|uniref:Uncharacterized protein n=1 Tax=Saguinus oedipus TaxID=9490 RepID=A0ABQ9W722_SAGOE|nr:hypothetical protein P7K49_004317 [Saguinus oedipus]
MDGILDAIAKEGCSGLLEEVFLDLEVCLALSSCRFWGRCMGLPHCPLGMGYKPYHVDAIPGAGLCSCIQGPVKKPN